MQSENPAVVLRAIFERVVPPAQRAPGWARKWDRIAAWCDEPAEEDDDGLPPAMDLEVRNWS